METSLTEPRENVLGVDRHGFEYLHLPHLFVQDVRLYRRRPWRDPDHRRAEPPPPPPPPPPLRAAELGGWSRARLERFRRQLTQLRGGSRGRGGQKRPTAVRRVFTCLGGSATPAGSPSHSDEDDPSAEDGSSEDGEERDDGPEFTLTRSGRKSQRPPRGGRGKASSAAATPVPESPSRRGRGRGQGKGRRSVSRPSTPATPAKQPPATPTTDQVSGLSRDQTADQALIISRPYRRPDRCSQQSAEARPQSMRASEVMRSRTMSNNADIAYWFG